LFGTNGRTLTRSFAPAAQPTHRGLPLPGLTYPGHVASSHLPCASTLYSLGELPGVLSTRRAHGASPFRALPNRDRCRLSAKHPLLRLAYRSRQTLGLLFPHTSPRLVVAKATHRTDHLRPVPLGSMVLGAFGAVGIAARAASLQGFNPSARLGRTVAGFLRVRRPWLSWASSSLGRSPSRVSASTAAARSSRAPPQPHLQLYR
jgi:hypothetical protein